MHGILDGEIYTKHKDDQQQLRLGGNSWSINLHELPKTAKLIEYITPTSRYVITREEAFKHSFERNLGGEQKLIVPIKWWQENAVALND
jgi:hypothetical protein